MEPPPGIALDTPAGAELETPAGVGARTLGVAAFTSGMGPLLGHWIESGALTAEPELAALLGLHLHHGRERARLLTEELHRAVSLLAQAGIIPIVIKGMHTGAVYFPEPGTRPASDIDLVVGPAEAEAAGAALFAAGYEETNRQSRPYKSDWVPPGASRTLRSLEVTHRDNPLTLDLHTTLDRNFFGVGTVAFGPLGDSATRRHTVGDAQVRVLEQPLLTASLAAHASEGLQNLSMIRLVELVLVVRRDRERGELDWVDLCSLLERADALHLAYPAFEMAERLVPGTLDPEFRRSLAGAAPPRMLRVLEGLQPFSVHRFRDRSLDERFMWARGPIEQVRRALHMLWPAPVGRSLKELGRVYANRFRGLSRGRSSSHRADDPT